MRVYLAAPIFTERDRNFNAYLEAEILKRCPNMELYLAQNNKSINDKKGCANSADIYVGDISKLKESDMLITIMSGDLPPIGSSYEVAYYCALCEQDPRKRIIALYDDSREGMATYSDAKKNSMISGIAENQWSYINLLSVGFVKKWGNIYRTSKELINAVEREYNIGCDKNVCGIYKITNLKNNMVYIGQSINIYDRWLYYKRGDEHGDIGKDISNYGIDYFKFEIIEKCDVDCLDEKEKYWIEYYDSYNTGYNNTSGGSGDKSDISNPQCVKVYAYNLDGTFYKSFNSIASAARNLNMSNGSDISRCLALNDNQHMSGNYMWRTYHTPTIEPYSKPISNNSKKIYAYDINTRLFVKEFANMTEAGEAVCGKRNVHIADVAKGKRKSCMGFIWAYDYFDILPINYFNEYKKEKSNDI